MLTLIKTFLASAVVLIVVVGAFTFISIARGKFMGPAAPHSCADGCEGCKTRCENYNVDDLKEEIKANIDLPK